jgi:polar amino acid transport system substrate-binding protein
MKLRQFEVRVARALSLVAGFIIASASGNIAASETLAKLRADGVVNVAIANNPPYTILKPNGDITGMIPDLVKEVMGRLGVPKVVAVVTTYDAMISGLNAGRFDLVAAGLYMTPKRCQQILFSDPDTVTVEGFAVPTGNPKKIGGFSSFIENPRLTVALLAGGNTVEIAAKLGVPDSQVVKLPTQEDGFEAVKSGRADAYGSPLILITDEVRRDYRLEGVPIKEIPPSASGIGFRSSDREFRDAYNDAFRKVKKDGTFQKISEHWNFNAPLAMKFDPAGVDPGCAS